MANHPKDAEAIGTLLYAADRALQAMKDKKTTLTPARQTALQAVDDRKRKESNG
jgi:hypothetical protein